MTATTKRWIIGCGLLSSLLNGSACNRSADFGQRQAPLEMACTSSLQCKLGENCLQGSCVAAADCLQNGCAAAELCDTQKGCIAWHEACTEEAGCGCHIVNPTGQISASASTVAWPAHVLHSGVRLQPQVIFTTRQGQLLPHQAERFAVQQADGSASRSFRVEQATLWGEAEAGQAVLHAYAGSVHCQANLVNLGPSPSNGQLRFFVFDALTGVPLAQAYTVVDVLGDGTDAGLAPPTDAQGISLTQQDVARLATQQGQYSVSVFAAGYQYLSLVGLKVADGADLQIALTPLPVPAHAVASLPKPATLRRPVDFSVYEQTQLDGARRSLRLAVGGSSLSLAHLVGMPLPAGLADPSEMFCKDGIEQACFTLSLPMPEGDAWNLQVPVPDALYLASEDKQLQQVLPYKDYLRWPLEPSLRIPWVLGGEFATADMLLLKNALQQLATALLTDTGDTGHAPRQALEALVQLMPKLSLGLTLPQVTGQGQVAAVAPQLILRAPMRHFTDVHVPTFPAPGQLDTLVLVSGAHAPGLGFVPLGFGLGVDCLQGACLSPAGKFTHTVKGIDLCGWNGCLPDTPRATQDNHIAFFQAKAFAGLETQSQLTLAVALSVHALHQEETLLASGVLLPEAISQGQSTQLLQQTYLPTPAVPAALLQRHYQVAALPPQVRNGFSWVRFNDLEQHAVWQVFLAPQTQEFVAPALPKGLFAADWGDFPQTFNVTHMTIALHETSTDADATATPSFADLLRQTGGLSNFSQYVRAFALRGQNIDYR